MAHDILVVDDEADIRELIGGLLEDEGYTARYAGDADEALAAVRQRKPSLAILDVWLQGSRLDGIALLDEIRAADPGLPVIVISGHGTIETAVAAIRKGAYDFIEKPFKSDKLLLTVARALEASQLRREVAELRARTEMHNELIGKSTAANQLRQTIDRVAAANSRILISGPAGSGKELIARLVHARSPRAGGNFVPVSAAMMNPDRVEEELFGAERADGSVERVGLLEQAHGGTLFLDEVGDMPLATQGKLLRMLVEQRFRRLGGGVDVEVNVRVLSSTSRDLRALISQGRFREDLYHRLAVVPIDVPPLSDRREDIPLLVSHFLERLTAMSGLTPRKIGPDAMAALQAHSWPGNVRQLRNNVERVLILATGDPNEAITLDALPSEVVGRDSGPGGMDTERMIALPLRDARENFEREYLKAQISRFGGNISRTATFIGMERSALHRKLKSLGVGGTDRAGDSENDDAPVTGSEG
ncbi:sigma-54-dependent Fis family transcriptional regulator [Glycocaulis albus]|jgi:two-component system, NtrC family, nitrogen regulation response regulator NtrX|uniref:Sigma-54-dependent Fis family transcriptional regulator n=1 Tax=Glycocaulis albus TaxID=1382801 RepID=A0ABQ1XFW4_9PROT|nr:sigma-54 dependent transcriptional regulator [Glycocaulis albus]MBV5258643.1 sigma-54-dependent Fis family transcriptional regulator [Synechococcus moorigangaii CMS01]GGG93436.1 sigma-54-dependent Fis family transcriptional regulator [Glycocaulis albus]